MQMTPNHFSTLNTIIDAFFLPELQTKTPQFSPSRAGNAGTVISSVGQFLLVD